jgi:hypothetical protein
VMTTRSTRAVTRLRSSELRIDLGAAPGLILLHRVGKKPGGRDDRTTCSKSSELWAGRRALDGYPITGVVDYA